MHTEPARPRLRVKLDSSLPPVLDDALGRQSTVTSLLLTSSIKLQQLPDWALQQPPGGHLFFFGGAFTPSCSSGVAADGLSLVQRKLSRATQRDMFAAQHGYVLKVLT